MCAVTAIVLVFAVFNAGCAMDRHSAPSACDTRQPTTASSSPATEQPSTGLPPEGAVSQQIPDGVGKYYGSDFRRGVNNLGEGTWQIIGITLVTLGVVGLVVLIYAAKSGGLPGLQRLLN